MRNDTSYESLHETAVQPGSACNACWAFFSKQRRAPRRLHARPETKLTTCWHARIYQVPGACYSYLWHARVQLRTAHTHYTDLGVRKHDVFLFIVIFFAISSFAFALSKCFRCSIPVIDVIISSIVVIIGLTIRCTRRVVHPAAASVIVAIIR